MIFRRLRVPFDIQSVAGVADSVGSSVGSSGTSAGGTGRSETNRRRGGRALLPVVNQSVVTPVSSAIREISSTRNFRVPASDLESLLASIPIRRATSLWLIPASLMAVRTRVTSVVCALSAPSLVLTTFILCPAVAILAILTGV